MSTPPSPAHLHGMSTFDPDDHAETFDAIRRECETPLTLGTLRDALRQHDAGLPLIDDRGRGLGDLHSYRGYYDQLAMEPTAVSTVDALVRDLDLADGETFTGWKGGDFTMGADTVLWVAFEGSGSGLRLCGVTVLDGHVVVVTDEDSW